MEGDVSDMTTYTKEKQSTDRGFDAKVRSKLPDVWAAMIRDKIPMDKHLAAWVACMIEARLMEKGLNLTPLQDIVKEAPQPFAVGKRPVEDATKGLAGIGLRTSWQSFFSKQEIARIEREKKRKAKKGRVAA